MGRNTTLAEERAEADARARWNTDEALRAEFANDLGAFVAYRKAEARGQTKLYGGSNVVRVGRAEVAKMFEQEQPPAAPRQGARAGVEHIFRENQILKRDLARTKGEVL